MGRIRILRSGFISSNFAASCLALLLTAVFLAGCGGGAAPRDSYYRLLPSGNVPVRAGGPIPGAVEVQALRADGLLNGRAILFRDGPTDIEGYSYHFWWQAPGVMLQESLIDTLRTAQAFETVAGPEMKVDRTYDILGRIRRLEQGAGGAHVELELTLRAAAGGAPLLLKVYREDEATSRDTVSAAVTAFSTAVGRVWTRFIGDLATVEAR